MNFGAALDAIKHGKKALRVAWLHNDSPDECWLELQVPDENSKMTAPYIYVSFFGGGKVPWVPNQQDLLADDWMVDLK